MALYQTAINPMGLSLSGCIQSKLDNSFIVARLPTSFTDHYGCELWVRQASVTVLYLQREVISHELGISVLGAMLTYRGMYELVSIGLIVFFPLFSILHITDCFSQFTLCNILSQHNTDKLHTHSSTRRRPAPDSQRNRRRGQSLAQTRGHGTRPGRGGTNPAWRWVVSPGPAVTSPPAGRRLQGTTQQWRTIRTQQG